MPTQSRKVFFVGMHNKEAMKPLDSKTMSGKMIDCVIEKLPYQCIKTNLCECEYQPIDQEEIISWGITWHDKYPTASNDIIVLLGQWVHKHFTKSGLASIIKLPHPASCMGNVNKENYIKNAIEKISTHANK